MAETVGTLIDKRIVLGIRRIKLAERAEDQSLGDEVITRLRIVREQADDFDAETADLIGDVFAGRRQIKVYRQLKMYNDPMWRRHEDGG